MEKIDIGFNLFWPIYFFICVVKYVITSNMENVEIILLYTFLFIYILDRNCMSNELLINKNA